MKVMVRVDGGLEVGFAHVVRLQQFLNHLPFSYQLTVVTKSPDISSFFEGANVINFVPSESGGMESIAAQIKPDIFICDHPHPETDLWKQVRWSESVHTIAIDDYGGDLTPDCVINGTVLPHYHEYPNLMPSCLRLLGPDYALLRSEFGAKSWNENDQRSILVVIGGGARAQAWASLLLSEKIAWPQNCAVKIVVGWSFKDLKSLQLAGKSRGIEVLQGLSALDLAHQLRKSTVSLMTGGMIVYEALACGAPSIVFPQELNLVEEAEWFSEKGCIVNLGYSNGMDANSVSMQLHSVMESNQLRTGLSRAGRKLIDGRGTKRAVDAISHHFNLH